MSGPASTKTKVILFVAPNATIDADLSVAMREKYQSVQVSFDLKTASAALKAIPAIDRVVVMGLDPSKEDLQAFVTENKTQIGEKFTVVSNSRMKIQKFIDAGFRGHFSRGQLLEDPTIIL